MLELIVSQYCYNMWLVLSSSMCSKVGHWCSIYVATFLFFSWTYIIVNGQGTGVSASQQITYVYLQTRLGKLLGTKEQIQISRISKYVENNSSFYYAFRGLAYAEKPVGNLRFQDPIVKQPNNPEEFINATVSGSVCAQWTTHELIGSEDCLFADVYIPARRKNPNKLLKIMVFFHGGGFIKNSDRNLIPTPLLLQDNVMVVLFNYRVSIFGYLSTGTVDLPGNFGSLDQIALLKWVQEYAQDFGADPNHVTLFGSSIGAVSIHYLLLSKLAEKLFHRAILESGSAFCERSLVPNPLEIAGKVGSLLGCQDHNPPQLVACISKFSTAEIMATEKSLVLQWVLPSVLGPVIDAYSRPPHLQFLPDYPEKLPVANKVPVILGITKEEGLTAFVLLTKSYTFEQLNNLIFIKSVILPKYLNLIMRARPELSRQAFIQTLVKQVMQVYREGFRIDPIATLTGILSDLWINTCHRKTVEHLCYNNVPSVYPYLFTHHDQGVSPSEIDSHIVDFHNAGINHPILDTGAAHTEEVLYVLQEDSEINTTASKLNKFVRNRLMSEIMTTLWTSFANDVYVELS